MLKCIISRESELQSAGNCNVCLCTLECYAQSDGMQAVVSQRCISAIHSHRKHTEKLFKMPKLDTCTTDYLQCAGIWSNINCNNEQVGNHDFTTNAVVK